MTKVQELFACNECGKWPVVKIVNTDIDEIAVPPKCDKCGGETHFEKAYEIEEEQDKPMSLFEHCKQESGLTDRDQIVKYMNRYYGHG